MGVGVPSYVKFDEGRIVKTVNLTCLNDFPARDYLSGKLGLPVALVDERLSSAEAEERLSEAGHKGWRKQKPRLDSAAAQIILLQYFESAKHADS